MLSTPGGLQTHRTAGALQTPKALGPALELGCTHLPLGEAGRVWAAGPGWGPHQGAWPLASAAWGARRRRRGPLCPETREGLRSSPQVSQSLTTPRWEVAFPAPCPPTIKAGGRGQSRLPTQPCGLCLVPGELWRGPGKARRQARAEKAPRALRAPASRDGQLWRPVLLKVALTRLRRLLQPGSPRLWGQCHPLPVPGVPLGTG